MLQHAANRDPLLDIAIEHQPDQINTLLAHDPGDAQVVVHNFVNAIKGIFLVDDGVEQDTEGPDVLFLTTVRFAGEDLGSCVVCGAPRGRGVRLGI